MSHLISLNVSLPRDVFGRGANVHTAGVLPTARIIKFARDNRGLMIHYEPDDLDLKIYGLRSHAPIGSSRPEATRVVRGQLPSNCGAQA